MDILIAVLLGAVQGLLEFLPVSSSGHLVILEHLTGFSGDALIFNVFLHAGTMIAAVLAFSSDVSRVGRETADMAAEFFHFRRTERNGAAVRRHTAPTNYRRMAQMVLASFVTTAASGILLTKMAGAVSASCLYTGVAFLITGIFLAVTSRITPGNRLPKDLPLRDAYLCGAAQGLSVIPGISRAGVTVSVGILSGMSRGNAIRMSYLMSIPAVLGALLAAIYHGVAENAFDGIFLAQCLCGMAAAMFAGFFAVKRAIRFFRRRPLGDFANYCFLAGVLSIVLSYAL